MSSLHVEETPRKLFPWYTIVCISTSFSEIICNAQLGSYWVLTSKSLAPLCVIIHFFMDQCCGSDPHTGSYCKKPLTRQMKSALHTLFTFLCTASAFIQVVFFTYGDYTSNCKEISRCIVTTMVEHLLASPEWFPVSSLSNEVTLRGGTENETGWQQTQTKGQGIESSTARLSDCRSRVRGR